MSNKLKVFIGAGLLLLVIAICLIPFYFLWGLFSALGPPEPVEDISQYQEIRTRWYDVRPELVEHFPEEIPVDANDAQIYYLPGYLQGGDIFELKLKLPPPQLDELVRQYEELGVDEVAVDNYGMVTYDLMRQAKDIPTPALHTSSSNPNIIVLGAEPRGKTADFIWNHGQTYGLGIDVSNSEVIYWLESW